MNLKTRSQHDMGIAARRVTEVRDKPWAADYGRLCHNFPVMVLTCGLCQAVAFSAAKAQGDNDNRKKAHARLLEDVAKIIGCEPDHLSEAPALEYMLHTRRVLAAWIYYKRFAVSILKAEQGGDND